MNLELQYLGVAVGLFVVPKVLQRFRLPSAITCVAMGAALGMGAGLFEHDDTVPLLATFGIVSLFLFAGLEVDFAEIKKGLRVVLENLLVQSMLLAGAAYGAHEAFDLAVRPSLLFGLALTTPSTGFILDSLAAFGLDGERQIWVKNKAISTEILALGVLFFTVQSGDAVTLGTSTLALAAMLVVLPFAFRFFVTRVLPRAPKSEFSFLLIVAVVCAFITKRLGVYYLVGAFVVGVTAVRLRKELPAMASDRLQHGVELFASFFIPFYFFKAGLHLEKEDFGWWSIGLGLAFVVLAIPLRVVTVAVHRRISLKEPFRHSTRVALSLVPTLVFTIVLAGILKERYALKPELYGALVVFALVNTLLPGLVLRAPPVEFDAPVVRSSTADFEGEPARALVAAQAPSPPVEPPVAPAPRAPGTGWNPYDLPPK
ncbi:MAG: cation:proton antiporter [Polyangiaceae bacterium]|nr:cation:proton antiporter [Polyangiaceae bacterium]